MLGLIGVAAVLAVLFLSLIITRLATVALVQTGMSTEAARFQARSAFTGTGFTTAEAERVVGDPVRRRIIMWLMVVRSAGIVSILISLILSFGASGTNEDKLFRLGVLTGGLFLLWLLARSRWFDRRLSRWLSRFIERSSDIDLRDYVSLLNLSGEYSVREVAVGAEDWAAGQCLRDMKLMDEGVLLLGIYREDGSYVGAPAPGTRIEAGDTLIMYGRSSRLKELEERGRGYRGESAHEAAVSEQRQKAHAEQARDESRREQDTQ